DRDPPLQKTDSFGRGATPGEKNHIIPADDHILDDATTLLAALRLEREITPDPKLLSLLHVAGLLKKNIPQAEAVRKFLEASRSDALQMLVEAWQSSETFNELRLVPGIICEGEWKNQPLVTREFLLNLLDAIPNDKWWNLNSFVNDIKKKYPDFQRPAGDYDSWFIKRESDGQYLRGFAHWDEVDGALIRFFITDILYSLGMAELAGPQDGKEVTAFRITTPNSRSSNIENAKLKVASNGKISAPRLTPRSVRYQVARFCEWDEEKLDDYKYRITPHSLTKAKEQGLKVEQLLALLAKHTDAGIPPVLVKALKRWEVNGTEARAETQIVLKVSRSEVLEELRKSKAARFLGEPLGPTTVTVKSGAIQKVMDALAEMGLLAEGDTNETTE
ncbi:MAG TPA: helicase-associated domain-containing protein, partial [Anaerolineales bacterium]